MYAATDFTALIYTIDTSLSQSRQKGVFREMNVVDNILSVIGNTPIVKLNRIGKGLDSTVLAKLELLNPGGSVKDRIGLAMLRKAIDDQNIRPGGTIIEPTSGNTGVGLAMAATFLGYRLIVTMPDKMSIEKKHLLEAYGAKVIICPTNVPAGDPQNYIEVAKRLSRETPNSFVPNQYFNEANPRAHYETTGPEIWSQTDGKITHFVAGIGTGGTISGVGKYLKEKNPNIQVIGVDPQGSAFYDLFRGKKTTSTRNYKIEGIGEDFLPGTTDLSILDDIVRVSDKEAYDMARRLAVEEAIIAGSSSGAAVVGTLQVAKKTGKDSLILTILPDRGDRYLTKLYNRKWLKDQGFA
jgi:cystathionine beta-synthase